MKKPANASQLLEQLDQAGVDSPLRILSAVVRYLRPTGPIDEEAIAAVEARMTDLRAVLDARVELYDALTKTLRDWLSSANFFLAFASLGILPRQGFRSEVGRRLYEHINPAPRDPNDIADMLLLVFNHRDDPVWVSQVSDRAWQHLFGALWRGEEDSQRSLLERAIDELLYAMEMLSIWVAAEELEADLVRLEPRIQDRESAFVGLQRELAGFARDYELWMAGELENYHDDAHARVLLDQCASAIGWFRKRAVSYGTSIPLTYLLERLEQTLQRIEDILDILDLNDVQRSSETTFRLFRELVGAVRRRSSLRALWKQNVRLLARSVTESASDHGDHYVTRNRSEYWQMLRSAAGAGLIIPWMALLKIDAHALGLAPLQETTLYCLIYGLGFVLIHMLGFTVATKQPAMTAARFANAVEAEERGGANLRKLAQLLVQVTRSQFIAIVGNVSIALSIALLTSWLYQYWQGDTLLVPAQQDYQRAALMPFASLALFHAAIAGVWLFLSGLVAGYFDNRAAYLSLAERFRRHPLIRPLLPAALRERLGKYIADHYGEIAGNFLFGVMLGATGYVGMLLALPLDIRHVAFSSANLGYAGVSDPLLFAGLFGCVLLIGVVNLLVSFWLALLVALRARGVRIQSYPRLAKALWQEICRSPLALFWPPPDPEPEPEHGKDAGKSSAGSGKTPDKAAPESGGAAAEGKLTAPGKIKARLTSGKSAPEKLASEKVASEKKGD